MTASLAVFGAVLALLWGLDRLFDLVRAFVGPWRTFTIFHIALLASAAVSLDRNLAQVPPRLVYSIFLFLGVVGVIWAGVLARQEMDRHG
ncbi:MAG: hypothetical protein ACOY93_21590 [Bacillota bacterium]